MINMKKQGEPHRPEGSGKSRSRQYVGEQTTTLKLNRVKKEEEVPITNENHLVSL